MIFCMNFSYNGPTLCIGDCNNQTTITTPYRVELRILMQTTLDLGTQRARSFVDATVSRNLSSRNGTLEKSLNSSLH